MGLFDGLKATFGQGKRERMFSPAGVSVGGRIPYPKRGTYLLHVQNGYKANPIVAACVGLLSSTMNEPPLGVAEMDGTVNLNHPLSVMFRRPNPYMGQAQFWAQCWQFLSLSGNAYIKIIRGEMGNATGFLPYGDAHVSPVRDDNGWIVGYQYSSQGVTQFWKAGNVIHLRHPLYIDPLALDMGMSPIEVAWDKVQTYNELQSSIYSLVASNMVPSGILTAPGEVGAGAIASLRQQLAKRRDAKGKERTEPLVLGSGMTYVQMGLDAQRLQATETLRELEAAICAAFRVHPAVIGSSAGLSISTYNNLQSAYAEFTTLLRVPMWNAIEEQLEACLSQDFPGVQLAFDLGQVQALQPDVDAVVYPAIASFNANLITQNETRAKMGYDPVEDGDKYMFEVVPAPTGFGMASAQGGEGQKLASAKTIVIVDIDDTLLRDGNGIAKNVAFVNDLGKTYRIEIVSGRPDSRRALTENELRDAGVEWNGLHLNDTTAPAIDFKKYKAGLLLKEYDVHLAIDNDADTRDMYSSLGIPVKNPATIGDVQSNSAAPLEMKFAVEGGRVKWDEEYAVKSWQDEERILKRLVSETEPYVVDLLDKCKAGATAKVKGTKANPADGIDVEKLVKQYMTATASVREKLAKQIIDMTISSTNVDFAAVQSFIDDIMDTQTRQTASMMKESCQTIKNEVARIAEANAGNVDAMREAITKRFDNMTAGRAAMIARTTVRAQSTVVQNQTVTNLNRREPDANKAFVMVWLSQRDSDVRPSHDELDGKWIEVGGSWTEWNSGITKGPGIGPDPSETINCRCVQRPTRRSRINTQ